MLLLDTSVLIDLELELAANIVGPVRAMLGRSKSDGLACSVVTVGELAVGADETRVRILLHRIRKIPVTEAIAYQAGTLDRALARIGQRLGENDTWIAATALSLSATLVYADGDFERVAGLKRKYLKR